MASLYDMGRLILTFTYEIKIISKGQKKLLSFWISLTQQQRGQQSVMATSLV